MRVDLGEVQSWRQNFAPEIAALYFPWVNVRDPLQLNNQVVRAIPPSGHVAGVYAAGMLKGRRDRYHRIGFLIPFTVAATVMPVQIFVGDVAAREVFHHEPAKFSAEAGRRMLERIVAARARMETATSEEFRTYAPAFETLEQVWKILVEE